MTSAGRSLWLALALAAATFGEPGTPNAQVAAPPAPTDPSEATADNDAAKDPLETFAFHVQSTFVEQGVGAFHSPYSGPNSLPAHSDGRETWDLTAYFGARLWPGAEVWIDPEVDQGFGVGNTLGVAGFTSGEASYKIGQSVPYVRVQRFFIRQTIDLGGVKQSAESDLNQLNGDYTANRLVITVGKFSVVDVFDNNSYAHDPRGDFLNWSVIEAGNFDYAADPWGYSAGSTAEWYQNFWTVRAGAFLMSTEPNAVEIDTRFSQFQMISELEARHTWFGQPGKLKISGFLTRARMGRYLDAVALAETLGQPADLSLVRRYTSKTGFSVNFEQQVAEDIGVFARVGASDGARETFDFTDIDRAISGGVSIGGARWRRPEDTAGVAFAANQASRDMIKYLNDGGLGLLIGDGRLPNPGNERIAEAYYSVTLPRDVRVSFDVQCVDNPAYNRDRGPVGVAALRLHGQF